MSRRAVLCPRCRRLIGSDESTCSWCGTSRTAPWWQMLSWSRSALEGDGQVRALITVNIALYALSLILSVRSGTGLSGILAPDRTALLLLGATGTIPIDHFGRGWSLVTANYLHGGLLHLIFNMMALRQIAPWTANEFGPSRTFIIYTVGGTFGFLVSYLAGVAFTIGASAAICSLIGALLYFGKSRGGAYGNSVYREVSGWVISLLIFGLIMPGINNWGHGGGIVGGVILGKLLGYRMLEEESGGYKLIALVCAIATAGTIAYALFQALI